MIHLPGKIQYRPLFHSSMEGDPELDSDSGDNSGPEDWDDVLALLQTRGHCVGQQPLIPTESEETQEDDDWDGVLSQLVAQQHHQQTHAGNDPNNAVVSSNSNQIPDADICVFGPNMFGNSQVLQDYNAGRNCSQMRKLIATPRSFECYGNMELRHHLAFFALFYHLDLEVWLFLIVRLFPIGCKYLLSSKRIQYKFNSCTLYIVHHCFMVPWFELEG